MFSKATYVALCQQVLATVLVGAVGVAASSFSTLDIAGSQASSQPPASLSIDPREGADVVRVLGIAIAPVLPADFGDREGG